MLPASTRRRTPAGRLPPEIEVEVDRIRGWARGYGLDFYDTIFEVLDYDELNEVAAFGGFPTRYRHWKFGMEFEQLAKGYAYGLQKIYELVINNDPCYAYLLKCNSMVDQKLVIAHVFGHCDFFKNNAWFAHTSRKMMDEMANHGNRVRRFIEKHGLEQVEEFIDACLSIDNLIDYHRPFIKRRRTRPDRDFEEPEPEVPRKLRSKDYMDRFVNPKEFLDAQKKRIQEEVEKQKRFPEEPERDILLFLIEHAPLEKWQRDVLTIVRDEAYYFAPQGMTKILNEGWASYWHSTILTQKALTDAEVIDYADHHAGTMGMRPGMLNPYKIGIELFRDIEDRWNRGRFGKEWEACEDLARKRSWDLKLGGGREKIFEVRRIHNDITFIDEFLTQEFCDQHKLFTYEYNKQTQEYVIASRDFRAVKEKLLFSLANFGHPYITVEDANHENRGELYLRHRHEGLDLKMSLAKDTLRNIQMIWKRPVHIDTVVEKRRKVLTFDGKKHAERSI